MPSSPVIPNVGPYKNLDFYYQTLDLIYWLGGGGGGGITPADITAAINASNISTQATLLQGLINTSVPSPVAWLEIINTHLANGLIASQNAGGLASNNYAALFAVDAPSNPPYLQGLFDMTDSADPKKLLLSYGQAFDASLANISDSLLSMFVYGKPSQPNAGKFNYIGQVPNSGAPVVIFDKTTDPTHDLYITSIRTYGFKNDTTAVTPDLLFQVVDNIEDGGSTQIKKLIMPATVSTPIIEANYQSDFMYPYRCVGTTQLEGKGEVLLESQVEIRGFIL